MKNASLLVRQVGDGLRARGLTVGVAESCTAGLLGYVLTSVPGSSDWFRGGVIAYSNDVKSGVLGVKRTALATHGAVSSQVASQMATGARRLVGADFGIAITGVAGPGGGTNHKPVGLVWIALARKKMGLTRRHVFSGTRKSVRAQAVLAALGMLKGEMEGENKHG